MVTHHDKQRVVALYAQGASLAKVAVATGVSKSHVYRIVTEAGVARNYQTAVETRCVPTKSSLSIEELIELYKTGLSLKDVGARAGISDVAVRERLKRAGYERREVGPTHKAVDRELHTR